MFGWAVHTCSPETDLGFGIAATYGDLPTTHNTKAQSTPKKTRFWISWTLQNQKPNDTGQAHCKQKKEPKKNVNSRLILQLSPPRPNSLSYYSCRLISCQMMSIEKWNERLCFQGHVRFGVTIRANMTTKSIYSKPNSGFLNFSDSKKKYAALATRTGRLDLCSWKTWAIFSILKL